MISHELNNSLAPIASLAHSGRRLAHARHDASSARCSRRSRSARATYGFILGYAQFAKLPRRGMEPVAWEVCRAPARAIAFQVDGALPGAPAASIPRSSSRRSQSAQERARIGRRAGVHRARRRRRRARASHRGQRPRRGHERGAGECAVAVLLDQARRHRPRARAVREIAEAHGGRSLANRAGGGAMVLLWLPDGS